MAIPSNKSSSSSSAASNPNPRSSEISNPMRRTFSGNPFAKPSLIANPRSFLPNTPASSPSDFPRRNSVVGRESVGSLRDHDDKENEKDQILKPAKVRSPAASTKNFMSPTISASSKITESPRKKVLIERNEPAPTFIPSTDGKSPIRKVTFAEPLVECGDLRPNFGLEEKKLDALLDGEMHSSSLTCEDLSGESVCDMNVPLIPMNDIESPFETVNFDPTFKLSPTPPPVSSTATVLAPLDADPLMPPYDPKTNYLSPRPQFLRYKPRPRMEICNEREFEDSFISESFSDTEVTAEDTQSEEGSQKESEDVSSVEIVKEEVGRIFEPSPAGTFMPGETVEAKEVHKPCLSMRSKAIALLLLLSVAFISFSVTNSPMIDHNVLEEFYEVYESSDFSEYAKANFDRFSEFAIANFDGLARNFHVWFTKSLSSISELIANVRVQNLSHLHYCNLTVQHDYIEVNHYPIFDRVEKEIGDTPEVDPPLLNVQESDAASEIDTDEDIEDISAEHFEAYEEQVQQDMGVITGVENVSDAPESEKVLEEVQPATVIESEQALQLAEAGDLEAKQAQENDADFNVENQPGLNSEAAETEQALLQLYGAGNLETEQAQENDAKFNVDKQSNVDLKRRPDLDSEVAEIHTEVYHDKTCDIKLTKAEGKSVSIVDSAIRGSKQRLEAIDLPPRMVLYLLLCGGTVLIAGAALNWSRKSKSRGTRVSSVPEGKEIFADSMPAPNEQISLYKPSLRNGPIEMDVLEEPCPSEMSSFQKSSSSYRKKVVKELNEAHSLEKKRKKNYRRESLASSSDYSMGSPSYGSLTVYEKIPSKQGHGDEETKTPVRRSSRIRNQATSPL